MRGRIWFVGLSRWEHLYSRLQSTLFGLQSPREREKWKLYLAKGNRKQILGPSPTEIALMTPLISIPSQVCEPYTKLVGAQHMTHRLHAGPLVLPL